MKRVGIIFAVLALALASCEVNDLVATPTDGAIVDTSTVVVTGQVPASAQPGGTIDVNGVPGAFTGPDTWEATIPVAPTGYVTVVNATYTEPGGKKFTQETSIVNGPKIDDGEYSPNGVGMRFTNQSLTNLGPVINQLAGGSFDISGLILAQDPLVPSADVGLGHSISGNAYEAGAESLSIGATSTPTGVRTPITVTNLYLGLDLQLSGPILNGPCKLEAQVPTTTIDARLDLRPAGPDTTTIDVNMVADPTVDLAGVTYEFISGVCDPSTFLLGSIINSVAGDSVESSIRDGFTSQLRDPDGSGPLDSPIADALEVALDEVSIAGPVGEALKVNLDAPFTEITETSSAIEFRSNADFFATFGTGPADCQPPANSPDFQSSFDVPGVYPSLGATSPGGQPYGLGIVVSSSAFNQLLSSMTECGMLTQDLTELGGQAITPTFLSLLIPEFSTVDPAAEVFIRIDPKSAPFITDAAGGPNGAMSELRLANLHVDFFQKIPVDGQVLEHRLLGLSVQAPLGLDLAYDDVAGELTPTLSPPTPADVQTRVYKNGLSVNPTTTAALFSTLFPSLVGGLTDTFTAFPLPGFLGLQLSVAEVARQGQSFVLYSDLDPIRQTRIENVNLTDLSSADGADDDALSDSNEWRHRIRRQIGSDQIRVDYKAVIGADACCFADDEQRNANAGYRLTFNVVPEDGDTWRLDLSQMISGAHTVLQEDAGSGETSISTITGRARIGGGGWQGFDVTPSSSGANNANNRSSTDNRPFTGSNATVLTGTTPQTITVEFGFSVMARSESQVFPPRAGDEAAVRIGANDSLANGFTAGGYPGVGNRDIAADGHVATIALSTS